MRLRYKNRELTEGLTEKSAQLRRFAQDMVQQNWYQFRDLFSHRLVSSEEEEKGPWVLSRNDIRRVVEKHICPELDHPQVVGAVVDCLYEHFRMT